MRFATKSGLFLIIVSFTGWLVEISSGKLSDTLGALICKERYLQPVNGMFGDVSCGFNFDMLINSALILMMLIGFILLFKSSNKHTKSMEQESIDQ